MTRRTLAAPLLLLVFFATARGEEPAKALRFVHFGFEANREESLAVEYFFEQGKDERIIIRYYRPKEGIRDLTTDLSKFRFVQSEYFVGDWWTVTDESDGFEPLNPTRRSEWKLEYMTRHLPSFLSQEENTDIDKRQDTRRFIKKFGVVPMPRFPENVKAKFLLVRD